MHLVEEIEGSAVFIDYASLPTILPFAYFMEKKKNIVG